LEVKEWGQTVRSCITGQCFKTYCDFIFLSDLEWWLASNKIVETELEDNPSNSTQKARAIRAGRYIEDDSEDNDD